MNLSAVYQLGRLSPWAGESAFGLFRKLDSDFPSLLRRKAAGISVVYSLCIAVRYIRVKPPGPMTRGGG